jgi:hypothetical protein
MKRLTFMGKVSQLVASIRERGHVTLGEACAILNVDPDSVKRRYVPVVLDLHADIRWDGRTFETIVETRPRDQAQKSFTDYFRDKGHV